jgi:hypothetical protein
MDYNDGRDMKWRWSDPTVVLRAFKGPFFANKQSRRVIVDQVHRSISKSLHA